MTAPTQRSTLDPTRPAPYQLRPFARRVKRAIDIVGASVGLAMTAPVLAVAALAIRRELGSPVLFRQRRGGRERTSFEILKFRSMRPAPEGPSSIKAVASDADRVTPLGRFLRESSIDELPTLLNVLRGEMSLVGPRPLFEVYRDRCSPEQRRRHIMPPGMTGWAQVNGRNARRWADKFQLDNHYIDHWSLWLDLKILVLTPLKVLRGEGVDPAGATVTPEFTGNDGDADIGERAVPEVRCAASATGGSGESV